MLSLLKEKDLKWEKTLHQFKNIEKEKRLNKPWENRKNKSIK